MSKLYEGTYTDKNGKVHNIKVKRSSKKIGLEYFFSKEQLFKDLKIAAAIGGLSAGILAGKEFASNSAKINEIKNNSYNYLHNYYEEHPEELEQKLGVQNVQSLVDNLTDEEIVQSIIDKNQYMFFETKDDKLTEMDETTKEITKIESYIEDYLMNSEMYKMASNSDIYYNFFYGKHNEDGSITSNSNTFYTDYEHLKYMYPNIDDTNKSQYLNELRGILIKYNETLRDAITTGLIDKNLVPYSYDTYEEMLDKGFNLSNTNKL